MWMESRNPATNTMEAFLIEAPVDGGWAVSTFFENEDGYGTNARAFTLRRDERGSMRAVPKPRLMRRAEVVEIAHLVMALLAIGSAPMLTGALDDKPPRRDMTRFRRLRIAEPWADIDKDGLPRFGKATRPSSVADEGHTRVHAAGAVSAYGGRRRRGGRGGARRDGRRGRWSCCRTS